MPKKKKSSRLKLFIEFIKVNLAGNVLFWTTYASFPIFYEILEWPRIMSLVVASLLGNVLFFLIDKHWIFVDKSGRRKTSTEVVRFIIFMTLNFFINIAIIEGLAVYFNLTPYIGQFAAALFFSVWNFVGLKFWVFQETHHHALTVHKVTKGRSRARR